MGATSKDILGFFANSAVEKIALFSLFAIIVILLKSARNDRREFSKSCNSLEDTIFKLSEAVVKNTTADEEKDKKHMAEFSHIGTALMQLNSNVLQLNSEVIRIHSYCMGKENTTEGKLPDD